tara:strand:+ start:72 stop:197 length:126 start_codon:yes stop_codon:yes gene_type:complete
MAKHMFFAVGSLGQLVHWYDSGQKVEVERIVDYLVEIPVPQ